MTPIENTIEISRAPDVVFSYLTDLHLEHEWNEQLRSVTPLTDGPLRVGAKFRVHFRRGVGDSIIEYRHFEPPVSWRTTSTSKRLDVHFSGTITPAPHGSRITLNTQLLPHRLLRHRRAADQPRHAHELGSAPHSRQGDTRGLTEPRCRRRDRRLPPSFSTMWQRFAKAHGFEGASRSEARRRCSFAAGVPDARADRPARPRPFCTEWRNRPRHPMIIDSDVAGIVESVGDKVSRFSPGDSVYAETMMKGGCTELVVLPKDRAALMPSGLTFEQAAAVRMAGVTALVAVRDAGRLQPGQTVLINGASGQVPDASLQFVGRVRTALSSADCAEIQGTDPCSPSDCA